MSRMQLSPTMAATHILPSATPRKRYAYVGTGGRVRMFLDPVAQRFSAHAEIVGKKVVVSSDAVAKPVAVRFAMHQFAEPNFSIKDGLPASPFRTDEW